MALEPYRLLPLRGLWLKLPTHRQPRGDHPFSFIFILLTTHFCFPGLLISIHIFLAAKEREKAQRLAAQRATASSLPSTRAPTPVQSPSKGGKKAAVTSSAGRVSGASTPVKKPSGDQQNLDMAGLNLGGKLSDVQEVEEPPKMALAKEKVLEEARKAIEQGDGGKKGLNIVVVGAFLVGLDEVWFNALFLGHVDAGKSTLMGRLLYELGRVDEKTRKANERESSKLGKSSFHWAWNLDGTVEERER